MAPEPEKGFSELQLGIRELYRIVVPGAYMLFVAQIHFPTSSLLQRLASQTSGLVAIAFFGGLIAYAARFHECWWPYLKTFNQGTRQLNKEIVELLDVPADFDHRALYKYFLTIQDSRVRDRVHYFSSFYYMLCALSGVSYLSAGMVVVEALQAPLMQAGKTGAVAVGYVALLLALGGQLRAILSAPPPGEDDPETWRLDQEARSLSAFIAFGLAVFYFGFAAVKAFGFWLPSIRKTLEVVTLIGAALLFGSLGNRQWRYIIGEQCVFVRSKATELRESNAPKLKKTTG